MMTEHLAPTIRQVQHTDIEELTHFLEENNRPDTTRQFHPFPLTRETACEIARMGRLDRFYVTISKGTIVGLCMLRGWDAGFDIPSFGILVDHRYHCIGLGRHMTEFAIAEAKRLGCGSVRLTVYASNVRSVRLYLSLGFKEIYREPVIVAAEADTKLIMMKDLKK